MKSVKRLTYLILAMFLLAACGSVPTGGLTSFMGASETQATPGETFLGFEKRTVSQCDGVMDLTNNTVRLSFQLENEEPVFGAGEQFIFGGGTGLLAELPGSPEGNVRFRCKGAAEIAAVPLKVNGQTVSWMAALKTSGLELEAPSGATQAVEAVTLSGMLAPTAGDLNIMFETLYGTTYGGDNSNGFQNHFATQKALYVNYPDSGYMLGQALKAGQSEENAALWGQIYTEMDVNTQRRLLVQAMTAPGNEALAAQAVGATVKTLWAMGLDVNEISAMFSEQTNGRITVNLSKVGHDTVANATFDLTSRDDSGNVEYTAQSQEGGSESGGSPGTGGEADPPSDPPTDPEPPSDPPSDPEPPSDPPTDPEPPSDPPTDPGGSTGGIWDLFWNMFQGAAAGATLGAAAGPEGVIPGAELGAAAGAFNWYMNSGVWDPDPNDPKSPCNSPLVNC